MLTTRTSKRDKVGFFNTDLMFDIMDGESQLGTLVYVKKTDSAKLELGGQAYTVERESDRPDEVPFQMLVRLATGREKPPPNPYLLKAADGRTLASALRVKSSFDITRGTEKFSFRQVGRPYHLFREGSDRSLGSVGQEKLLTKTLHMDLLAEFDPPFQVFLLVLVLALTMKAMEGASGYTP